MSVIVCSGRNKPITESEFGITKFKQQIIFPAHARQVFFWIVRIIEKNLTLTFRRLKILHRVPFDSFFLFFFFKNLFLETLAFTQQREMYAARGKAGVKRAIDHRVIAIDVYSRVLEFVNNEDLANKRGEPSRDISPERSEPVCDSP